MSVQCSGYINRQRNFEITDKKNIHFDHFRWEQTERAETQQEGAICVSSMERRKTLFTDVMLASAYLFRGLLQKPQLLKHY